MILQNNQMAVQAGRLSKTNAADNQKAAEWLSSGYRINRAADDAAALTISEKMRSQIRGLNQGTQNLQEGISLAQVADGALEETQAILQRLNELSVKAANGTNTQADRNTIQNEVDELVAEIDRIAYNTTYNEDIYPLLGGSTGTRYTPAPGTANQLAGVIINGRPANSSDANAGGEGSLTLTALAGNTITGAGGLGAGSAGTMVKVKDDLGNEVKVMLHRDAYAPGGPLTVSINGDNVTFHYNDPVKGIKFDMEQSYSIYNEIDEATQTGYSFYNIKNTFTNLSGKNITYDIATAFDNFAGRYTAANPYYVNGVPHSTQMKENAAGNGNYQIVTPPIPGLGVMCELVTRISGDGITEDADKFIMLGDTTNQSDRNQVWQDLYSSNQSSGGSASHQLQCDEIYGLWMNKPVASGGTYSTNVLQGIRYRVIPGSVSASAKSQKEVWIQSGAQEGIGFHMQLVNATAKNLKLDKINVQTQENASKSIGVIENALSMASSFRSQFGSYQNRMEHSANNNENTSENLQSAESSMRDTDVALAMLQYSKTSILKQASQSMLAQANKMPQRILSLLQP